MDTSLRRSALPGQRRKSPAWRWTRPEGAADRSSASASGRASAISHGSSTRPALLSYGDTFDVGVNVDTAAVPDPDVPLTCLEDSFAEIVALGGAGK
jgi:hypothetical protein